MKREILINATPRETRVAILEDDELVELLVDRPDARRMVGDIYLGKVDAVLPGLQAAFVDIGTDKSAFLHSSDLVYPDTGDGDDDDEDGEETFHEPGRNERDIPQIQDVLDRRGVAIVAAGLAEGLLPILVVVVFPGVGVDEIGRVQEGALFRPDVDEGGLDAGKHGFHPSQINVADHTPSLRPVDE